MNLYSFLNTTLLKTTEALPEGTIISLDKSLLINSVIQIVNVLVLTAVLVYILYKPVKSFMANRTNQIQSKLDHAENRQDEAEELKELYEKKLKDIEAEREEILSEAHKKAMERSDRILVAAREGSEHIYNRTMAELAEERESVEDDMRRQLLELSVLVAGKFIEDTIDDEMQNQYIDQALSDWEEGLWLD